MASTASPFDLNSGSTAQNALYTKLVSAAIVLLFILVFFTFGIHVFGKWNWNLPANSFTPAHNPPQEEDINDGGLDRAAVDSLPLFVYGAKLLSENGQQIEPGRELECAVCLCSFEDGQVGRLLSNCRHSFHTDCIDVWFQTHSTCPVCRAPVLPETVYCTADVGDHRPNQHEEEQQGASRVQSSLLHAASELPCDAIDRALGSKHSSHLCIEVPASAHSPASTAGQSAYHPMKVPASLQTPASREGRSTDMAIEVPEGPRASLLPPRSFSVSFRLTRYEAAFLNGLPKSHSLRSTASRFNIDRVPWRRASPSG